MLGCGLLYIKRRRINVSVVDGASISSLGVGFVCVYFGTFVRRLPDNSFY
jgi:hypothetical protein